MYLLLFVAGGVNTFAFSTVHAAQAYMLRVAQQQLQCISIQWQCALGCYTATITHAEGEVHCTITPLEVNPTNVYQIA